MKKKGISVTIHLNKWLNSKLSVLADENTHNTTIVGYNEQKKTFIVFDDVDLGYVATEVSEKQLENAIGSISEPEGFYLCYIDLMDSISDYKLDINNIRENSYNLIKELSNVETKDICNIPEEHEMYPEFTRHAIGDINGIKNRAYANILLFEELKKQEYLTDQNYNILKELCNELISGWDLLGKSYENFDSINARTIRYRYLINKEKAMWEQFINFITKGHF